MRISDWSSDVSLPIFVVGFNRFFREEADLTWETLVTETMLVAVPSNHRLAKNRSLSIEDLANEPLVFYPRVERPQGFTDYLRRMFHKTGRASCRERACQYVSM